MFGKCRRTTESLGVQNDLPNKTNVGLTISMLKSQRLDYSKKILKWIVELSDLTRLAGT